MKAAVRAAGSGEGCRQQWGCALQMGQVLLEGMAMGPHAALPCSRRSPRLGVSCWHRVLLRWGVAVPMPQDGGAAPGRAG